MAKISPATFANHALSGLLAHGWDRTTVVKEAWSIADEMVMEQDKRENSPDNEDKENEQLEIMANKIRGIFKKHGDVTVSKLSLLCGVGGRDTVFMKSFSELVDKEEVEFKEDLGRMGQIYGLKRS